MHRAPFVSGPAPFLERIGTRSQDSINEGSFAGKVTCFPINVHRFPTKWRRSLVVKVQLVGSVRSGSSRAASTAGCLALKSIDSGLVL